MVAPNKKRLSIRRAYWIHDPFRDFAARRRRLLRPAGASAPDHRGGNGSRPDIEGDRGPRAAAIAAHEGGEACVCDLTEPLELSQPTVSHHLKLLFEAGLLGRERRRLWIFYRLIPERLQILRDALGAPAMVQPVSESASGRN